MEKSIKLVYLSILSLLMCANLLSCGIKGDPVAPNMLETPQGTD